MSLPNANAPACTSLDYLPFPNRWGISLPLSMGTLGLVLAVIILRFVSFSFPPFLKNISVLLHLKPLTIKLFLDLCLLEA